MLQVWEISGILICPFLCMKSHTVTSLEVRSKCRATWWFQRWCSKITFGKLLGPCGMDRESADLWFLSHTSVGVLPASLVVGRIPSAWGGLLPLDETQGLSWDMATDTNDAAPELDPKADFTISTVHWSGIENRRFKNIAAQRIGKIAAG